MCDPVPNQRRPLEDCGADDARLGHFMNVDDVLELATDDRNDKTKEDQKNNTQTFAESSGLSATQRKAHAETTPFFGGRFAYNMRVDNIIVNCCSSKWCDGPSAEGGGGVGPGSVMDTVSSIASGWKRQAEALSIRPADTLDYYKKQFDELFQVLSICLFNHSTDSHLRQSTTTADTDLAENEGDPDTVRKHGVKRAADGKKKKRISTPSNDCEYIFFDKNGKFVYRRVESAEKYAKRSKPPITKFVCILPRAEDHRHHTKTCMAKLRKFDQKFASGSELNFTGTYGELKRELVSRLEHTSLDRFAKVEYCFNNEETTYGRGDDGSTEAKEDDCGGLGETPKKRAKKEEPKITSRSNGQSAVVKGEKPAVVVEMRRSGVEDYTDSEDSDDSHLTEDEQSVQQHSRRESATEIKNGGGNDNERIVKTMEKIHGGDEDSIFPPSRSSPFDRPPSPFLHTAERNLVSRDGKKKR